MTANLEQLASTVAQLEIIFKEHMESSNSWTARTAKVWKDTIEEIRQELPTMEILLQTNTRAIENNTQAIYVVEELLKDLKQERAENQRRADDYEKLSKEIEELRPKRIGGPYESVVTSS